MPNLFLRKPGIVILFILSTFTAAAVPPASWVRLNNGVLVSLTPMHPYAAKSVRLQAVTPQIIHVTASYTDSLGEIPPSLMIVPNNEPPVRWEAVSRNDTLYFTTAALEARISLISGAVSFFDAKGSHISGETTGGRFLQPQILEGKTSYKLTQQFETKPNEAWYGLGQYQNGIMNYRGTQVELQQYNSTVAVPLLVTDNRYAVLWDNYSITKVGDGRDFEPLSTMKLYAAKGQPGWLTATYSNKNTGEIWVQRPESEISYDYIANLKALPKDVPLENSLVTWEGAVETSFTGTHQFLLRYGGYAKLWIDGVLKADRWRQSWNPGTALVGVPLEKGKKYRFKIEWQPDGKEAYLSCKWISPIPAEQQNTLSFVSEAGDAIDYYFIYGEKMDDLIAGYRILTGKAAIAPRWALGKWQSRERYKTQEEILETVKTFREKKIPLDNIVLDWSYWKENQWGSHEFDSTRFPDAAGMIQTLHQQYKTKFMISVWPKYYQGTNNFREFEEKGFLYYRNVVQKNLDWIGKGYVSTFYDAYHPGARDIFWKQLNRHLFTKGIDAWWLDATEPDVHSNLTIEERKEIMTPNALGSSTQYFNAYALQNAKGIYEGQRSVEPNRRVFILTRSAYAGLQRYGAATWSGDIASRWHDLRIQIPAGINFSLSGLPYWTSDIGGFSVEKRYENAKGEDLEEWRELNARWYQYGAFCPLFRVHGQFPYREMWNIAPESHPAYKSMLYYDHLRYRLMPYIYSLAGMAYHQNTVIMRAPVMDFPQDAKVKNLDDEFMLGPSLLVAPVTEYKARSRELYLPEGAGWYDFYTGRFLQGGQTLNYNAPYERVPLFVKEGTILPIGPALQYTAEKKADTITLWVFAGKDASFSLYEDEDLNYNYENGNFSTVKIQFSEKEQELTIENRIGSFDGMLQHRVFRIVKVGATRAIGFDPLRKADKTVRYNGRKISLKI